MLVTEQVADPPALPTNMMNAAARLFARNGYAATTTREITKEVGIQKATLYHYISGKDDLLYAICTHSLEKIHSEVERAYDATQGNLGVRLFTAIESHLDVLLSDQDLHRTMLKEFNCLPDERRNVVRTLRREYQHFFTSMIKEAQASGHFHSDEDPETLSLIILGALNWTTFWYSPQGRRTPREIALATARAFGIPHESVDVVVHEPT